MRPLAFALLLLPLGAGAQAAPSGAGQSASPAAQNSVGAPSYVIGAGDQLSIFVWKNPDLSVEVPVRPDGKISTPLVPDIQAQGKTPTELGDELRTALSKYIQDPVVTVLVKKVAASGSDSAIRVIGAAVTPKAVPYHAGLTVLDVMIDVGGLNTYADGNDAELIRDEGGVEKSYPLHLADLLKSGDIKANMKLMPGDIIRIPQRWF